MGIFSFLGLGKNRIVEAIHKGAVIIDVRPAYAFDQNGRIPDSINIPVDRIAINIGRIKSMKRPIVLCCAYGNDCEKAAAILRESGVKDVYVAGNWQSLYRKL
jgi:rhodanese-related sulfurtransferase